MGHKNDLIVWLQLHPAQRHVYEASHASKPQHNIATACLALSIACLHSSYLLMVHTVTVMYNAQVPSPLLPTEKTLSPHSIVETRLWSNDL